jgi:transcriptional regulator with XRE-family HTH domain
MSQEELAKAASVGLSTLRDYEKGLRTPVTNNLQAIRTVLEGKGFRFSEKSESPQSLSYTGT